MFDAPRILVPSAVLALAAQLPAAEFVVTNNLDDGSALTLRSALAEAFANPGADTIRFDPGLDGGTITLSRRQLSVEGDVVIDASDLPNGITIDADLASSVMIVLGGANATLRNLTIRGGYNPYRHGGGIHNENSNLTLEDCVVRDNRTGTGTSSGGNGAGILNLNATLNLIRCVVRDNTCGIGPIGGPGGAGGGIHSSGLSALTLTDCTVEENSAGDGGWNGSGGQGGGIFSTGTNCTLLRSTIAGNRSGGGNSNSNGNGGSGGGMILFSGIHFLENCTIANNRCGHGVGTGLGGDGGGIFSTGDLNMDHCTVTGNWAGRNGDESTDGDGQGVYNGASLTLTSSIISGNQQGRPGGSELRTLTPPSADNLIGGDAMLGPLGSWGGPTRTCYLRPGSPAVDAATGSGVTADQRGTPRQGTADYGAYELVTGVIFVTTRADEDGSEDPGTGRSLREALNGGEPFSTIQFDPAVFTTAEHTIFLEHGQLSLAAPVAIDASSTPAGVTIDAGGTSRVVAIPSAAMDSSLHSLTLTRGSAEIGGGVSVGHSAVVELIDVNVSGSSARVGGGISNHGYLTLADSTLSGNSANNGGGVFNNGYLTLTSSTLSGNSALSGGGIWNGQDVTLTSSTLSGNSALNGGGILTYRDLTVTDSTLSGNSANSRGGGISNYGNLTLTGSTLSGNSADTEGGGIYLIVGITPANSIVAGNTAPTYPNMGPFSLTESGFLTSGDPRLAPLGDYGGPTQTMPPLPGSPAIDMGTGDSATDQRGLLRPLDGDGDGSALPDIGAVEYDPAIDLARFWPLDWDGDGTPYGPEQAVGTDPFVPDAGDRRNFHFPEFTPGAERVMRFGINPAAHDRTDWIVYRSLDLSPSGWIEVYRREGAVGQETFDEGFTAAPDPMNAEILILTDPAPPDRAVFYQLRIRIRTP